MKRSDLTRLVKEVMKEANVTGGTATFTPGTGEQFATPNFLGLQTILFPVC